MLSKLVFRRLAPTDADAFHAMALASWMDAYGRILSPDIVADAPRMISSAMAARYNRFMAVFEGAQALGYYSLGDTAEDQSYLWHLYVHPSRQRQGIGEKLHTMAIDELRARGCRVATLDYVAGNAKAARFYVRHGWRESGRAFNDGLELVLMKRPL